MRRLKSEADGARNNKMPDTIPCLSLWQPWASLIALDAKRIETRSWSTAYRGPLAIHAAKRWTGEEARICATHPFWTPLLRAGLVESDPRKPGHAKATSFMPFGAIVALVELIDCVPTFKKGTLGECWLATSLSPVEQAFGDYSAGRFGWRLKNVRALPSPVPYRGEQGLFHVSRELLQGVL